MKRIVFIVISMLFIDPSLAKIQEVPYEKIPLQMSIVDSTSEHEPIRLSPMRIPSVATNGVSLQFITPCDNDILSITNKDGNIEYVTTIPEGTKTLILPSYLSGEYYLQITRGRFCFWSYITL